MQVELGTVERERQQRERQQERRRHRNIGHGSACNSMLPDMARSLSLSERWATNGGLFRQAFTTRGNVSRNGEDRIAAAFSHSGSDNHGPQAWGQDPKMLQVSGISGPLRRDPAFQRQRIESGQGGAGLGLGIGRATCATTAAGPRLPGWRSERLRRRGPRLPGPRRSAFAGTGRSARSPRSPAAPPPPRAAGLPPLAVPPPRPRLDGLQFRYVRCRGFRLERWSSSKRASAASARRLASPLALPPRPLPKRLP